MSAIAKGLIARLAAGAKRHAVARDKRDSVRAFDGDVSHYPDWPANRASGNAFDGFSDLRPQFNLHRLSIWGEAVNQRAGWAIFHHFDYRVALFLGFAEFGQLVKGGIGSHAESG